MKSFFDKIENAISSLVGKMDKLSDQFESKIDNFDKSLESKVNKFDRKLAVKLNEFDLIDEEERTDDDHRLKEKISKQNNDSQKRIAELEARIAELEKTPADPKEESKREVIVNRKVVSGSDNLYFLTSEGRVLLLGRCSAPHSVFENYVTELKKLLIEIGEETAVDLSDFTDKSMREEFNIQSEKYKQFQLEISRLAAKFGSKGLLPALLPNDKVLFSTGVFGFTSESNKQIKFK